MKIKCLCALLCLSLTLTGCSLYPSLTEEPDNTWEESGYVTVGSHLTVNNGHSGLVLLNNKDVLAPSEGLYYASWVKGDARPYENSDGDTLDLYDAQIYLLLGEFTDNEHARSNMESWLSTARSNYEILSEKDIDCNGQDYTLITYNCINEENPYDVGASAFGVYHQTAVCVELTCLEGFEEEPKSMLTEFLENCDYSDGGQ